MTLSNGLGGEEEGGRTRPVDCSWHVGGGVGLGLVGGGFGLRSWGIGGKYGGEKWYDGNAEEGREEGGFMERKGGV
jgi:hypothetical protein